MPDYRKIYNHVVSTDSQKNFAENSPGHRAVIQANDKLSLLSGRSLDIGCGVGFVVSHLSGPEFAFKPFGVDISDTAIEMAQERLKGVVGGARRLSVIEDQKLNFDDEFFTLVTCFDVLEHLDASDINATLDEVYRVLRVGGVFYCTVSCRKSGADDQFGQNLHRTVKSPDWWIEKVGPDTAEYDGARKQFAMWKRKRNNNPRRPSQNNAEKTQMEPESADTSSLYQKIYDDNPWYGDAEQGRCPGVRLLPQYRDWLIGPVMDLGCGRGQTVEHLKSQGFEATGIDQIRKNPEMRVGDITQPISDIARFKSVVCVDCIEHLYEAQVLGLFENMKQVERQAFSIHNGESTGTGQELHVNRKSFDEWSKLIEEHFVIHQAIEIHPEQMLYLTRSK